MLQHSKDAPSGLPAKPQSGLHWLGTVHRDRIYPGQPAKLHRGVAAVLAGLAALVLVLAVPAHAQTWWGQMPDTEETPEPRRSFFRRKPRQKTPKQKVRRSVAVPTPPAPAAPAAVYPGDTATTSGAQATPPGAPAPAVPADNTIESANPYSRPRPAGTVLDTASSATRTGEVATTAPAVTKATPAVDVPSSPTKTVEPIAYSDDVEAPALRERNGCTAIVWKYPDSLAKLAEVCGVPAQQIMEANRLRADRLVDGQVLRVPVPANRTAVFDPARQQGREITRGIRGRGQVCLTFDAGGETEGLDMLLANLARAGVRTTFFVTGTFVRRFPDAIRRIHDAGHEIFNHSWSHPEFPKIMDGEIVSELMRTDAIVREQTGRGTRPYFRPPFGERDARTLRTAASAGFQSIYWTLDSLDSLEPRKTPEFIVSRVMTPRDGSDPGDSLDGAIVLMHVGEPASAAAVPEIVNRLAQIGLTPVPLSALHDPYPTVTGHGA